jgi:hypothetical protein
MGNYATVQSVKDFKAAGSTSDVESSYSDIEISNEIDLMESLIENICNDVFYTQTTTNKFDGNGLTKLFFQPDVVARLISVTSVKDYDINGTTLLHTYTEGTDFVAYDYYLETAIAFPEDTPRRGIFRGGKWPRGQQNIWIEGTWGRASAPLEITRATLLLTLERLMPGFIKMAPKDVSQVVWGDFTASFKGVEAGQSTGYVEIDRLLERYVNRVDMFLVVPDKASRYGGSL